MKFRLFFIFLFLAQVSNQAWAYKDKDISLSDHSFRRYVLPQLRNIINDFISITGHLKTAENEILIHHKKFALIQKQLQSLYSKCPDWIELTCKTETQNIYNSFVLLEKTVAKQLLNTPNHRSNYSRQMYSIQQLFKSITKIKFHLHNVLTSLDLGEKLKHNESKLLGKYILSFNIYISQYLATLVDNKYYPYFKSIWSNFLIPLQYKIYYPRNQKYLESYLDQLNHSLHTYSKFFIKTNKKTPKKVESLIKIIGNRWNSILKLTLKR